MFASMSSFSVTARKKQALDCVTRNVKNQVKDLRLSLQWKISSSATATGHKTHHYFFLGLGSGGGVVDGLACSSWWRMTCAMRSAATGTPLNRDSNLLNMLCTLSPPMFPKDAWAHMPLAHKVHQVIFHIMQLWADTFLW